MISRTTHTIKELSEFLLAEGPDARQEFEANLRERCRGELAVITPEERLGATLRVLADCIRDLR